MYTIHDLHDLLQKKRLAHDAVIRNPSSSSLRAHYTHVHGEAQRSIRAMKTKWWQEKAAEIESFADIKDTKFLRRDKASLRPGS